MARTVCMCRVANVFDMRMDVMVRYRTQDFPFS